MDLSTQRLHHPDKSQSMTELLADQYPEAAPYIQKAVAGHGEDWVLEHDYEQLYPLGQGMRIPEKDELPFSD